MQKRSPELLIPRTKRLSRLSNDRELGILTRWLETWDNLPLESDSTHWTSPESLIEFICSCICCSWEVSCWIVSWFFQKKICTENSSTCCSCALFILPISCILRICVSRENFFFAIIPLTILFVLDEIRQFRFVLLVMPVLCLRYSSANHWCTYWVTWHDFSFVQIPSCSIQQVIFIAFEWTFT